MKITIAANVYPPEIGGPSEYARRLYDTLLIQNHDVKVVTFSNLKKFPTGLRHCLYGCKLLLEAINTNYIIALDTFSVGLPGVIFAKFFGKKIVIRVAGDFLWEAYSDRVIKKGERVLLSDFYKTDRYIKKFTLKEKIIFWLTKDVLKSSHAVVFSTEWQKNIMMKPYGIEESKAFIIENYYPSVYKPETERGTEFLENTDQKKIFLSPSRDRAIKNKKNLSLAWDKLIKEGEVDNLELDTKIVANEVLSEKIEKSYAVVVPSFSEVSPNMVLEALASGVPSVVTQDNGIKDRLEGLAVFIDPFSVESITNGLKEILNKETYERLCRNISSREFSHSWNEIAQEFIDLYSKV
jgi:glycosyltransferase involved in cell wall biosynthesis